MNDFGKQGGMVINRRRPVAQPVIFSTSVGGILLAVFLWRSNIIRTRTLVLLIILFMLPSLGFMGVFYTIKRFSGLVMRNYDLVEQPMDLEGFTHHMLREATDFLQARHDYPGCIPGQAPRDREKQSNPVIPVRSAEPDGRVAQLGPSVLLHVSAFFVYTDIFSFR